MVCEVVCRPVMTQVMTVSAQVFCVSWKGDGHLVQGQGSEGEHKYPIQISPKVLSLQKQYGVLHYHAVEKLCKSRFLSVRFE